MLWFGVRRRADGGGPVTERRERGKKSVWGRAACVCRKRVGGHEGEEGEKEAGFLEELRADVVGVARRAFVGLGAGKKA